MDDSKITNDMLTEWFAAHPSLLDDRAVFSARQVRTIVREAVAARRTTPDRESIIEECAKVCDDHAKTSYLTEAAACARKIRALKTAAVKKKAALPEKLIGTALAKPIVDVIDGDAQ
ncbi:MAG: hypothetical protein QJR04_25345 [Burkholderia multivorans]|nr:hypothetical protein [Burkholderia multivorans]